MRETSAIMYFVVALKLFNMHRCHHRMHRNRLSATLPASIDALSPSWLQWVPPPGNGKEEKERMEVREDDTPNF